MIRINGLLFLLFHLLLHSPLYLLMLMMLQNFLFGLLFDLHNWKVPQPLTLFLQLLETYMRERVKYIFSVKLKVWLYPNAFMDGWMDKTHLLHSLTPLCKPLHTAGGPSICGGTGPGRTTWTAGHETTQTASDGSGFAAVLIQKYTYECVHFGRNMRQSSSQTCNKKCFLTINKTEALRVPCGFPNKLNA